MRQDDRALIPLHGHQVVKSRDTNIASLPATFLFP